MNERLTTLIPATFERVRAWWPSLLLVLVGCVTYGQILGHDFLLMDDKQYVYENPAVYGITADNIRTVFSSFYVGNYAPLQMLSYMLDYSLWGLWPGGFLLTNMLLHLTNSLLYFTLLQRWLKDVMTALTAAMIFLLHPVQVETVAWVSQRKTLLAMLFFLMAWGWFDHYRKAQPGEGRCYYTFSIIAFTLSLLSKSVTMIFPLVIIVQEWCDSSSAHKTRYWDKIPYLLTASVVGALAVYTQLTGAAEVMNGGVVYHGGGFIGTMMTMVTVFFRYIRLLILPVNLSTDYAPTVHTTFDATVFISLLLLLCIIVAIRYLLRVDRGIGFWALLYLIGLLPVSQVVPLVTLMNDRYLYFPLLGGAALVGLAVKWCGVRLAARYRWFGYIVLFSFVFLMVWTTYQRTALWSNSVTLWSDEVKRYPLNSGSWEKLGQAYYAARPSRLDDAIEAYQHALQLNPGNDDILFNSGFLYYEKGDYTQAQLLMERLLAQSGKHVMGWAKLGDIHMANNEASEAEQAYLRAYTLQPDAVQVITALAGLYFSRGDWVKARTFYSELDSRQAPDPEITITLALVEARLGHDAQAITKLEQAIQQGFSDMSMIHSDTDLKRLWNHPRIQQLLQSGVLRR